MSIFLGSMDNDLLGSRNVQELFRELDSLIASQSPYLLPEQQQELLRGITIGLSEEKAWGDDFARRSEEALTSLSSASDAGEALVRLELCRDLAVEYFARRGSVLVLNSFCTDYRDQAVRAAIRLAEADIPLSDEVCRPVNHAWCAIGSYGRGEASLTSSCDLFLVYSEESPGNAAWASRMGKGVGAMLQAMGLASTSGISPIHAAWQRSTADWLERIDSRSPAAASMGELIALRDIRLVTGSDALATALCGKTFESLHNQPARLHASIRSAASLPVGFDFFGRLKVEKSGAHRGSFNLLQSALMPLVLLVRLLAIRKEITATATPDRIRRLLDAGELGVDLAGKLLRAFHEFARRLLILEVAGSGSEVAEYFFTPAELSEEEEERFKLGLESLFHLQRIVIQGFEE